MRKKKIQEEHTEQHSLLFLLTPSRSPFAAQNLSPSTPTETNMNPHASQAVPALLPVTLQARHHPSPPELGIAGFLMTLTCQISARRVYKGNYKNPGSFCWEK